MATVYLSDNSGLSDAKLLSYSGSVKGGAMVLTLKIEVGGFDIAPTLAALEAIQKANNQKPARKSRKPLALPAPNDFQL